MIDAKSEIQYILVTRLLTDMARAGFLTDEELAIAKHLAVEKYRPLTVWESMIPAPARRRTPAAQRPRTL